MAFRVSVKADVKKAKRGLTRLQRKQLPFATALALTNTAWDVKAALTKHWHQVFIVRNKQLPKTMWRVKKADKRDRPIKSEVFDRLNRAFVPLQSFGGTKTPFSSPSLVIPTRRVKRTRAGKISKAQGRNVFRGNPFGKGEGIWQQFPDGSMKLLFHVEPTARVKQRFDLQRVSTATVRREFPRHLRSALKRALATAR